MIDHIACTKPIGLVLNRSQSGKVNETSLLRDVLASRTKPELNI